MSAAARSLLDDDGLVRDASALSPWLPAALAGDADVLAPIPGLAARRRGAPIASRCWENPDPRTSCWFFRDLTSADLDDFWMILTVRQSGPFGLVGVWIPTEDGGLRYFLSRPKHERVTSSTFLRTMKIRHGSAGVVSMSKLEVRVCRDEVEALVSDTEMVRTTFGPKLGPSGERRLLEPPTPIAGGALPPLPLGPPPGALHRSAGAGPVTVEAALAALDLRHMARASTLVFPKWRPDHASGDIVLDGDAIEVPGGPPDEKDPITENPVAEPGLWLVNLYRDMPYLDLLVTAEKSAAHPSGRILCADMCTCESAHIRIQEAIRKKKKSWFGGSTRLTFIRRDLLTEKLACGVLVPLDLSLSFPPEGATP